MVSDLVGTVLSYFPDAHVLSGYVRIRCPYHKGGKENKPSMSILLEQKGSAPAGLCHCFACGKALSVQELLSDKGCVEDFGSSIAVCREPPKITLATEPAIYKVQMPFRFSPYLEGRGISEDTQRKFKIYEKGGKVHMPVFDPTGLYLYDNARSTKAKRFFVESGATKTLWGIEEVNFSKPIAVCESQIDALSFWETGLQAVATLGADNTKALSLISRCTSTIVLAFDPDDAGVRARDKAVKMLGSFRCVWLDLPQGVDINQALQDIRDKSKFNEFMRKCTRKFVQ